MKTFATNRFLVRFAYFADGAGYRIIEKELTSVEFAALLTKNEVIVYAARRLCDDQYQYDGKAVTDWYDW